jgi:hypothetical protein
MANDEQKPASRDLKRLALDAAVAIGLLVALGVVFLLDRRSAPEENASRAARSVTAKTSTGNNRTAPGRALRLAVTEPEYDDMGQLLSTLGGGYRHTTISFDDLLKPKRLASYDVVFLTCGGIPPEWLGERVRGSEGRGVGIAQARPGIVDAVKKSLREYVGRGGTLYASDWRLELLAIAFPEFFDRPKAGWGEVQTIRAEVVDPGLQKWLGRSVDLRFDMPAWRPAAFAGKGVTTYLQGQYLDARGTTSVVPLLVSFPFQEGMVVFTAFHNEAQNSEIERKLLRYLVFTTVVAAEEEKINRTLVQGGFSPQQRGILRPLAAKEELSDTYVSAKGGHLQFVLGFRHQGATLRLTVVGPDGQRHEQSGTKTFTLDIPRAVAGSWRYTVTPLAIPYENFPFTLTIGEKP